MGTRGILLPFQRDQKADFANGEGAKLWESRVLQVLGVKTAPDGSAGEIAWRPGFGTPLHLLRHKNNTPLLEEMARVWARRAFRRWLPRVVLFGVESVRRENRLWLLVRFNVRSAAGTDLFPSPLTAELPLGPTPAS